ncbi:alpha/beta fold hydrolase [Microbacterium sp.]|uniref:alpha/beta fold hydrolase n=1 Tax=Microbacterium sp. TaxID=51671 RepID=UPI0037C88C1F
MREITTSDGVRIAWEERGSGKPLLLLMGLGADHSAWEPHVESWERTFRCILIDNRGAGASDAPDGPYTTARMADDAAEVLREVSAAPAGVVGISMGGAIAQQLALRHSELVDRIVITASWAGMNPVSEDVFDELRDARTAFSPEAFLRRLQLLIWSPPAYAERVAQLRADRETNAAGGMSDAAFAAQVDACVGHDVRASLTELTAPVLITCGRADVFTPIAASEELAQLIPDSTTEVFAGGHAHHWEELDRFNRLCEEFLR